MGQLLLIVKILFSLSLIKTAISFGSLELKRKAGKGIIVTEDSLLREVTDLAGVGVLRLHQDWSGY